MAKTNQDGSRQRTGIAYLVLIFSGSTVLIVGAIAIIVNPTTNIMPVFNVILPLMASWVGTVLAFYFGRENFESANQQVRELVQRFTPEQAVSQPVTIAMRFLADMTYYSIPRGKTEKDVTIKDLRDLIRRKDASRLPILDSDKKPKYMLHGSSVDKYLAMEGKTENDSLDDLLTELKAQFKMEFGLNCAFVVVPETATLAEAKEKMDEIEFCQDIFITEKGTADEPLKGWLSNIRLGKYTEA